jgi:hypothetical protein
MSSRSSFLGLVQRVHCDRCGERIEHSRRALCHSCSTVAFESLRLSDLLDDWHQKQTGYRTCCVCRKTFDGPLTYDVCLRCSWRHPDYSHSGWDNQMPPKGTTWAKHCFVCNAVQVVHAPDDGTRPVFRYFSIGSSEPTDTPFRCPRTYPNDLPDAVRSCRHEWIEVASTVTSPKDGRRMRAELAGSPVTRIMGFDDVDLDHIAFGETSFWCVRCGNFYKLSPNRYDILPAHGDNRR